METGLPGRLTAEDRSPTLTAFPDGSVDRFFGVFDGGSRVTSREDFADAVGPGGNVAFTLQRRSREPGGHAVNAAAQADLLGAEVTLFGHLDDPEFADLPFESHSMGDPAEIDVYVFDDGDVLAVEASADVLSWSFDDLRAAAGAAFESRLSADVVFCTNWSTFDGIPDALAALAESDVDGETFLFDPGAIDHRSDAEVQRLFEVLSDLGEAYEVVLAANEEEVASLASAVGSEANDGQDGSEVTGSDHGDEGDGPEIALERLRRAGNLAGAVLHGTEAAVAATPDGTVRVENFDVDPVRNTGGGDRFDAGLAYGLALDWPWRDALGLGNACASRYVATGESATPEELASFLREGT